MSFNDNIRLDPTRVGTSGAGRKVAGVGGGSLLGLLLVLGFSYFTGIDLTSLLSSPSASSPSSSTVDVSTCRTGADANARVECRMVATAQSLDQVWKTQLTQQGTNVAYELPDFQIFTNSVSTACGNATSAVGPFYCPGDSTVYLDLGFFDDMVTKYGASDSVLAQEYVVAHEWGHHIQNLQGVFRAHDTRETGEQGCGRAQRAAGGLLRGRVDALGVHDEGSHHGSVLSEHAHRRRAAGRPADGPGHRG